MPTTTRSCGRAPRPSSPICSRNQEAQSQPLFFQQGASGTFNQLSPPRPHPYRPRRPVGAASSSSPPAPLASPQATQPQGSGSASSRGEACSPGVRPCSATQLSLAVSLADTSLSSLEATQLVSASPGTDLPGKDDAHSDAGSVVCLRCEQGGSPLDNEILLCDGQVHRRYTT
jgi:hypothetical protein